jgi:hypothetical protein
VAGVVLASLALVAWRTAHTPSPVDDVVVIHPLQVDPPNPRVGTPVTATFTVGRQGTGPEAVARIAAGGRVDTSGTACQRADPALSWNAPSADFPIANAQRLASAGELTYRMRRTFDKPGWYFAEPVKQSDNGTWGGIPNANRVCFFVQGR